MLSFSLFLFHLFLIFMIYFLVLTLDFVCSSFSSSFRCRDRLFETFLFLEVRLYCYKLPLELLWLQPIGLRSLCFLFVSRYHSLTPYIKISSKWVKDIDVRLGTIKFLSEKHTALFDINLSNIFFYLFQSNGNKNKRNKCDLIKFKSFCKAKETINKMKRQCTEWEKIFADDVADKVSVSKIYKQFMKLNIIKINNTIKKWAKDLNRHFSKEDIQMAKKSMKRYSTLLITWKDAQHR